LVSVTSPNQFISGPDVVIVDEHGLSVSERHYQEGSRIELHCRVRLGPYSDQTQPDLFKWTKDGDIAQLPIKSTTFR